MWYYGKGEFDIDENNSDKKDREGDESCEACEKGDWDCEKEDERKNYGVCGVVESHAVQKN